MNKTLRSFVSDLERARDLNAALDVLAATVEKLGFERIDYGFVKEPRSPTGNLRPLTLYHRNFPENFDARWKRFAISDPFYLEGLRSNVPIDTTRIREVAHSDPLQKRAWSYLNDVGLGRAILIPMHLPDGAYATIGAYWGTETTDAAWTRTFDNVREVLFVIAHYFQDRVSKHTLVSWEPLPHSTLTKREQECLELIALGKSTDQTAAVLGRSPATIRFHLGNAFRKLGVTNRAGAVARALRLGHIGQT